MPITIIEIVVFHSAQPQISDASSVLLLSLQRPPQGNILPKAMEKTVRQTLISTAPTISDSYCAQLSIYPQNLSARGKAS
jgi:hypothetical protein